MIKQKLKKVRNPPGPIEFLANMLTPLLDIKEV